MEQKLNIKNVVIGIICGIFVGFVNGFFGGGGGMIVVPILFYVFKLQEKSAHATAILTILPISIASSIIYLIQNNVQVADIGFGSLGFMLGGIVGAILLKKISNKFLRVLFCLIMIGAGIKIIFN